MDLQRTRKGPGKDRERTGKGPGKDRERTVGDNNSLEFLNNCKTHDTDNLAIISIKLRFRPIYEAFSVYRIFKHVKSF